MPCLIGWSARAIAIRNTPRRDAHMTVTSTSSGASDGASDGASMHVPLVASERPTRLVILGHPVAHSLSPLFQNAALVHAGLAANYERLDVPPEALDATLDALARDGVAGNVTIPHKEQVASRAMCSPLATRVGAVNTFWHERGALIGHNTDVAGVAAAVATLYPHGIGDRACTLIGAGGSAAAVLVALDTMGCGDIRVVSRTRGRAEALVARLGVRAKVVSSVDEAVAGVGLVINATPIGLNDDDMPVAPALLAPDCAVFDLVYRRGETPWVRACRAMGHPSEDGLRMLLEQGAAAFECWFGMAAPRRVMWHALNVAATERQ